MRNLVAERDAPRRSSTTDEARDHEGKLMADNEDTRPREPGKLPPRSSGDPSPERTFPTKLAGGLDGTPAFLLASDAEIREAYRAELSLAAGLLQLANERIHLEEVGSPQWLEWARRIDAVRDAVDVHGWTGARRARMFLLSAVEDAVQHGPRATTYAPQLETMAELGDLDPRTATREQRARWSAAAREVGPNFPTRAEAKLFKELAGKEPTDDVPLFAAFLFRRRCPTFARGLVTSEGLSALGSATASWSRGKGRPKKGDSTLPKWDACDALMKAAGLVGCTPDSLETDWKAWNARRNKGG